MKMNAPMEWSSARTIGKSRQLDSIRSFTAFTARFLLSPDGLQLQVSPLIALMKEQVDKFNERAKQQGRGARSMQIKIRKETARRVQDEGVLPGIGHRAQWVG